MNTVEDARVRWIEDRPKHARFAEEMAARIQGVVCSGGIAAQVTARPKEVHSLVKKLLAKPHLHYENMPDKVGARVVVRYLHETSTVLDLVRENFAIGAVEDTTTRLEVDRFGYRGIHVDRLSLKADDALHYEFPSQEFFLELQLRTLSQHLWSEISHDSFYKNDALIQQLPSDLRRRVHLMAGQVEVADREFERMSLEIPTDPAAQLFKSLEPLYYILSAERPNVELSMEVIRLLLPLYGRGAQVDAVSQQIVDRFRSSEGMLKTVYFNPENQKTDAAAFLFQPEAMMIYDCLLMDRDQTLKCWNEKFPSNELERVATVFGISLE
jgi:ppGpp synthetase/RelA/SpoT-type nucleotidyltranferase